MPDGDIYPDLKQESLDLHEKNRGKIEIRCKIPLETKWDLSRAYTPGVADVCRAIQNDKDLAYKYTLKANTIAIVTDGTAVLGLGDIGASAAIPVMEGKAALFKKFAGIDAFPICFEKSDHIAAEIRNIAPVFGGINLEDIAAPRCFEIEEALQDLGIPVMHDDQHGTAIAVLAGLLNACKVAKKDFEDLRIVVSGAGAAGYAVARLLRCIGYNRDICTSVKEMIVCDRQGIIHRQRRGLYNNKYKFILADETNHSGREGTLYDALEGADVFIGVSAAGILTGDMIHRMNDNPIIFAMANPVPEIMPEMAKRAGAAIVATGRSDYPNQINNALVFPGVFRGALDAYATKISDEMKVSAAHALAEYVRRPTREHIIPRVLDREVTRSIAEAVRASAIKWGYSREFKDDNRLITNGL
ncbi:MAG: NADP-dependent malic enzyme [Methanomicrobiaceae archaeon]|nr:NADP-dependent malic enzyme [Methanomicrobiaceae archaeon]